MNHNAVRRSNLLIMHPDPILCAGLVAALRPHATFDVLIHGIDNMDLNGPQVDVVVADYKDAMRLTEGEVRRSYGLLWGG